MMNNDTELRDKLDDYYMKEHLGTYKCKNCGSPIKYDSDECSYCGTKNYSTISWQLKEITIDKK